MNILDSYLTNGTISVAASSPSTVKSNIEPEEKQVKDGNKKLKNALIGLGIASAAAIGLYAVTHKSFKLSDISFEDGFACLKKNGKDFTGRIKDTLKNGDNIILEYKNGIIQNSQRTGSKNVSKLFEYSNGEKIVHSNINGTETIVNITKKFAEIKNKLEEAKQAVKPESKGKKRTTVSAIATAAAAGFGALSKLEGQKKDPHQAEIEQKAQERTRAEKDAKIVAKLSQKEYNEPFEKKLSRKKAEKSATAIDVLLAKKEAKHQVEKALEERTQAKKRYKKEAKNPDAIVA